MDCVELFLNMFITLTTFYIAAHAGFGNQMSPQGNKCIVIELKYYYKYIAIQIVLYYKKYIVIQIVLYHIY